MQSLSGTPGHLVLDFKRADWCFGGHQRKVYAINTHELVLGACVVDWM